MPPVQIRPAQPDDVPILLELIGELAEYEDLTDVIKGDAHLLSTALFERKAAEALIAEIAEEAAGYAVFFTTFSTFECCPGLWIEDLFVRDGWRGQGIGRALLGDIAGLAVNHGCARLEWSTLDWNEPALRFYEELGATRLEQWRTLRLEGDRLTRIAVQ